MSHMSAVIERLERIATSLEEAEAKGRAKAKENLPPGWTQDSSMIDIFATAWMRSAISEAVRELRGIAADAAPRRRAKR